MFVWGELFTTEKGTSVDHWLPVLWPYICKHTLWALWVMCEFPVLVLYAVLGELMLISQFGKNVKMM